MKKTVDEYFREWAQDCRLFMNYKPIHDHQDMLKFAKDYHKANLEWELNEALNKAMCRKGRIQRPNSNNIAEWITNYLKE